jgi:hypothetical protein
VHGIGLWDEQAEQRVPAFVVGDAAAVLGAHDYLALGAQDDLLHGVKEVLPLDGVALTAGG